MLREAVFLFLRKYQLSVRHDFKNTAVGFDQLCLHPRFLPDRLCQTGSLGIVVSIIAVLDRNVLNHTLSFLGDFQTILTLTRGLFNNCSPPSPNLKPFSLGMLFMTDPNFLSPKPCYFRLFSPATHAQASQPGEFIPQHLAGIWLR